jgi:Outer membrane lipoprotein-sorting protein
MSVRHVLAGLLLSCAAIPVAAQDAQSLIARNLDARGGAAALAAIKAIRFQGRVIFPGDFELKYQETRVRLGASDASRIDALLQGLDAVQAYDGHGEAWKINPFQGRKDPERMSADEARQLADSSLVEGVLLASRKDGSQVEYLGREDFDGTLAYKLKVVQKDGDEFTYWLDPDTFLEIKTDESRRIRGARETTETELGDYEKVGGVYFPMSVESWTQGQPNQRTRVLIETAEANPSVTADYFAEPRGPATPAKAGGEPPDASQKPQAKKPPAKAPPVNPSKPPKGK